MTFRRFVFALAALPAISFAGNQPFDGRYSVSVGSGPLKDLYILSITGDSGTTTFAKVFQKPERPQPVRVEQTRDRMTVTLAEVGTAKLVFKKTSGGLTCISGCSADAVLWEDITRAKEVKTNPLDSFDFNSLPAVGLGKIDGAWIQSKRDPQNPGDYAFEIKGEFVKRYDYLYGLYPASSTPAVYLLKGNSFIAPNSGAKLLELKKVSETKLVGRYPQQKNLVYLYRADSIQFADLKKARESAEEGN